jgi:hypothetical protein
MKKIPIITFIQLLRIEKLKNFKKTNIMKKIQKKRRKKNLTLISLRMKLRREKKIRKVY